MLVKGKGYSDSSTRVASTEHREFQRLSRAAECIHRQSPVAVMPEVDIVEVNLDPNDVRVDVYRASGNGGQCVNTTGLCS